MSNVLLSLHGHWADAILDGHKKAELRRTVPRRLGPGDTVFLYATAPISAVVGEATVRLVETGSATGIAWGFRCRSCLSFEDALAYLQGGSCPGAILLARPWRYREPRLLPAGVRAPQSFCYWPRIERRSEGGQTR